MVEHVYQRKFWKREPILRLPTVLCFHRDIAPFGSLWWIRETMGSRAEAATHNLLERRKPWNLHWLDLKDDEYHGRS